MVSILQVILQVISGSYDNNKEYRDDPYQCKLKLFMRLESWRFARDLGVRGYHGKYKGIEDNHKQCFGNCSFVFYQNMCGIIWICPFKKP